MFQFLKCHIIKATSSLCVKPGRITDLSLVYPLARGTGPALSTLGAVILFREHPSLIALSGLALVVIGIFIIAVRFTIRHAVGSVAFMDY